MLPPCTAAYLMIVNSSDTLGNVKLSRTKSLVKVGVSYARQYVPLDFTSLSAREGDRRCTFLPVSARGSSWHMWPMLRLIQRWHGRPKKKINQLNVHSKVWETALLPSSHVICDRLQNTQADGQEKKG